MTVVNKRTHTPTDNDVYIGRGSIWGNPFKIGVDGTRKQVIEKYKVLLHARLLKEPNQLRAMYELKGKTLVCHCAPLACHGNVIEKLIEEMNPQATSPYLNKPLRTEQETKNA